MKLRQRIAVIDLNRCKFEKSGYACINVCPPQRSGIDVFEKREDGFPLINEDLCIGCGLCVKACPFHAITIVNLPKPIEEDLIHMYGPNMFSLYRLPLVQERKVLGLIGQNGMGKSTSLKILSGQLKPNLGNYDNPPEWDEIIKHFRGTTLQNYFKNLANGKLKVILKPQYVDAIPRVVKGSVKTVLEKADQKSRLDEVIEELAIKHILDRQIDKLSGGELQKIAIAVALLKEADVYMFDEPSSYLDVSERIRVAKILRGLAEEKRKTVIVAEHDLAILDYTCDMVSIYYGEPGAFGIVSKPRSTREGINEFLDGYLVDENVRFREAPIRFSVYAPHEEDVEQEIVIEYGALYKELGEFKLEVEPGKISKGEIIGIVGPNGIGKTTFLKLISGKLKPDLGDFNLPQNLTISYKPQYLQEFVGDEEWKTVRDKIHEANKVALSDQWFKTYVYAPLDLDRIIDMPLGDLSGGELQKAAIAATLAKKADIYFFDEPSAYISAEDRFWVAKTIKNLAEVTGAPLLVVDHDIIMVDYLAKRLIVFDGVPGRKGKASKPLSMREGMNKFLGYLGITFRRDKHTFRPRINKIGSVLDREQKAKGEYYYIGV